MKTCKWTGRFLALGLAAAALAALSLRQPAQAARDEGTAEVMRMKLGAAQEVLRGIALQDFALVRTNGQQLSRLSHTSGWAARQSPEYELFTVEFRRAADELVRAADGRNIDAATVSYTQMTFACVSCHKYMRGTGKVEKSLWKPSEKSDHPETKQIAANLKGL